MPLPLFSAPAAEASQFIGFSGNRIDRQAENRTDESALIALGEPTARLMLLRAGRTYLRSVDGGFDPYFSVKEATVLGAKLDAAVLLGFDAQGPVLAAPGGVDPEALPEAIKAIDFRSINVQGLLDQSALGAMAQAASLLAWHSSHSFCGKCGQPTEMRIGGYKRVCPSCAAEHFPRTDPVAIMLAVTEDRCLMGRGAHFPPGMYSALAGFIEPGETIEGAVRRETLEEAGIRLGRVVYHASQPWPFPYSLMIGCFGEALNEDITFDGKELEDCRWFARDEVDLMLAGKHPGSIFVPPPAAIAHHLIKTWAETP
ncbi:MAG: NAD(+) diphosphatase [Rhizobiaceae bacterium]